LKCQNLVLELFNIHAVLSPGVLLLQQLDVVRVQLNFSLFEVFLLPLLLPETFLRSQGLGLKLLLPVDELFYLFNG
jgi:hypothetical protein